MEDLLIINEGGQLLYSWHEDDESPEDDDLISGFLTAINNFATIEKGEDLKSLKLKETTIIFEKMEQLFQKLTFVITTKNDEFIELLHSIIHEIINKFIEKYKNILNQEFDGNVTHFRGFNEDLLRIRKAFGIDILKQSINLVNQGKNLKSVIYLEPKGGHIFYIHAKQYVEKEKISFLIPLLINSAKLLYQNNLNESIRWLILNTVRNEIMWIEVREKLLILKQYKLEEDFEEDYLDLEYFKKKEKYIKKPQKLIKPFEELQLDQKIKQIFLVDLLGKILYSKKNNSTYDCEEYISESISFITASKKACDQIYNRILFTCSILGLSKFSTICINFNNFAVVLIGDVDELNDFKIIQSICLNIINQIK